jgi:MFS family permease
MSKSGLFFIGISSIYTLMDKTIGSNYIIYLTHFHNLSTFQTAIVIATSSIVISLLDFPLGNIADLYGRKKILSIGFFLWSIGLFIYGISNNLLYFIVAIAIQHIGVALISGIPSSWYYDEVLKSNKQQESLKVFGFSKTIANLLVVLSGICVIFVLKISDRAPFIASAVFAIIGLIVIYFFMNENYGLPNSKKTKYIDLLKTNLREIKNNKILSKYILGDIFEHAYFLIFILIWQQVYIEVGLPKKYIGIFYTIMILSMAIGPLLLALKKFKLFKINILYFIAGFCIFIGFILCSQYEKSAIFFISGILLFELFFGLYSTINADLLHKIIKNESRTACLSAISSINELLGAFTILLSGYIIPIVGYDMLWVFGSILVFISFSRKFIVLRQQSYKYNNNETN